MEYIGNTAADRKAMLAEIGAAKEDELWLDIPREKVINNGLGLPAGLSELELKIQMQRLAARNVNVEEYACFLGAGAYDHYIPSTVQAITGREEFYTAYTPYQPEISQGTLQAIFEYQTLLCNLTGMDVANASLYDGATALYEAAHLACRHTQRRQVLVARTVHPEYRQVLETYFRDSGIEIREVNYQQGLTSLEDLKRQLTADVAAVAIQQPNFFGGLEEVQQIAELTHKNNSLFITAVYPVSLGLLKRPGDYGADIVVGEGQSLGLPVSLGGPYLGIFACRKELMRKMPGRVVGETVDTKGQRAFVLTLQTREQHIRREKATSNICSNEALCALSACVYLSSLGASGLRQAAALSAAGAHYLAEKLAALPGWKMNFPGAFYNEFVITAPVKIEKINKLLLKNKIIGGLSLRRFYPDLQNAALFCCTEKRTKAEIDELTDILGRLGN
jgi:glycine dehydrogenase subunit 1